MIREEKNELKSMDNFLQIYSLLHLKMTIIMYVVQFMPSGEQAFNFLFNCNHFGYKQN